MAPYNNKDPGAPGFFDLIFAKQFKWAPTIIFKWSPSNNVDPGVPGSLNLMSAN